MRTQLPASSFSKTAESRVPRDSIKLIKLEQQDSALRNFHLARAMVGLEIHRRRQKPRTKRVQMNWTTRANQRLHPTRLIEGELGHRPGCAGGLEQSVSQQTRLAGEAPSVLQSRYS